MANWVHVENNEITGYYDILPKNWKNVSGLDLSKDDLPFLKSLGWYPVTKQPEDYNKQTHRIINYNYEIRENDVYETYVLSEKIVNIADLKNQFMQAVRTERNKRLIESDWTQLADVQNSFDESTKNSWVQYRQDLRNVPQIYAGNEYLDYYEVVWPQLPE